MYIQAAVATIRKSARKPSGLVRPRRLITPDLRTINLFKIPRPMTSLLSTLVKIPRHLHLTSLPIDLSQDAQTQRS